MTTVEFIKLLEEHMDNPISFHTNGENSAIEFLLGDSVVTVIIDPITEEYLH